MCLQLGITLTDFCNLKVGTIFDILTTQKNILEKQINEKENEDGIRKARKGEDIMSFF